MLAELIAYYGDQLSYQQDAVATEAYLLTARSRISLRRHALLVDYRVHDGCNARAWVHLTVSVSVFLDHTATSFYTFAPGMPSSLPGNERAALAAGVDRVQADAGCDALPRAQPDTVLHLGRHQLLSAAGGHRSHLARVLSEPPSRRCPDLSGSNGSANRICRRRRYPPPLRRAAHLGRHAERPGPAAGRSAVRAGRQRTGADHLCLAAAYAGDRDQVVPRRRVAISCLHLVDVSRPEQRPNTCYRKSASFSATWSSPTRDSCCLPSNCMPSPSPASSARRTPPPTAAARRSRFRSRCAIGRSFPTARSPRPSLCRWPAAR